jgi:hypothetical protein
MASGIDLNRQRATQSHIHIKRMASSMLTTDKLTLGLKHITNNEVAGPRTRRCLNSVLRTHLRCRVLIARHFGRLSTRYRKFCNLP